MNDKHLFSLLIIATVTFTVGCSSTPSYKGVYENARTSGPLEVPPDLSSPSTESARNLPENQQFISTYSGYEQNILRKPKKGLIKTYDDMRFVREGSMFWLEIDDEPQRVWVDMRDFFEGVGFEITSEHPHLGVMETNWKENRVDIPTNWLSRTLGKLYQAEYKDRFRVRFEYNEEKSKTRVFIAHQGLEEIEGLDEGRRSFGETYDTVYIDWVPRPSDPGLEVEMLMRFMAFRGLSEDEAKQVIASANQPKEKTKLKDEGADKVLEVYEPFARTWRHVGLALDRMGVQVEDRNRSAGVYYVKLPETFRVSSEGGLFSSDKKPEEQEFLVTVEEQGDSSLVHLRSRNGEVAEMNKVSEAVLKQIQENIL